MAVMNTKNKKRIVIIDTYMINTKNRPKTLILLLIAMIPLLAILLSQRAVKAASSNLLPNQSVETTSPSNPALPDGGWNHDSYGTNTVNFVYPSTGYQSTKAIGINITSYTNGDAKWFFQDIPASAGQQYSYSDFYNATVSSDVTVRYTMANGQQSYSWLATLPPAAAYTQVSRTFTVPAGVSSFTVFRVIAGIGTINLDNFSLILLDSPTATPTLTPSPTNTPPLPTPTLSPIPTNTPVPTATPSTVLPTATPTIQPTLTPTPTITVAPTPTSISPNLIANPSVETSAANGTQPQSWFSDKDGTNSPTFTYPVAGFEGQKAVRIDMTQYSDGDAKWYFADVPVTPGTIYYFTDSYQSNANSEITVRYKKTNGTYLYEWMQLVRSSATWSHAKITFTAPAGVVSATVYHSLVGNGYLITDNFSLINADAIAKFTQGMVSLDFDDGTLSAYNNAFPLLNAAGFKGTSYIITNQIGNSGIMNTSQLLQLQAWGHEIGDHTRTHPYLTTLTPTQIAAEISGARDDLHALGITSVNAVDYPYGDYNSAVIDVAQQLGFSGARTTDDGINYRTSEAFTLRAYSFVNTATFTTMKNLIDQAVANKTWLIMVYHEIDNNNNQFSTTPTEMQQVVDYLKTNNVKVVTVSQGLSELIK